jgi:hypothetical protein
MKLVADENFHNHVVRGVRRRSPNIDLVRVQDAGLSGADDRTVLEWAAQSGRLLLTHDVKTIPALIEERFRTGLPMPGVIFVSKPFLISALIDDIVLLVGCSKEGEWEGQSLYLPFPTSGQ